MLKSALKHAIRSAGFDLRRHVAPPPENAHLATMLSSNGVNLVFDVGANIGQFALSLREAGYKGRIVSFEPLAEAWETLQNVSHRDELWEIAPLGAIGAENGEIEFHVSGDSQCSSVLKMHDAVLKISPKASYVGVERVPLRRLDTVGIGYLGPDSVLFIKADVQGFEDRVLKGAQELLKRAVGVYLEMSLIPLYEGQQLYDELIVELKSLGFNMWDFKPEYFDRSNGRMVWGCGTFFRERLSA